MIFIPLKLLVVVSNPWCINLPNPIPNQIPTTPRTREQMDEIDIAVEVEEVSSTVLPRQRRRNRSQTETQSAATLLANVCTEFIARKRQEGMTILSSLKYLACFLAALVVFDFIYMYLAASMVYYRDEIMVYGYQVLTSLYNWKDLMISFMEQFVANYESYVENAKYQPPWDPKLPKVVAWNSSIHLAMYYCIPFLTFDVVMAPIVWLLYGYLV